MQIRSCRGSGEPAWVNALSSACKRLGPDPRRALGPAATTPAASTGRTRDRTRPMLHKRQKVLARAPSTRDPKPGPISAWAPHWQAFPDQDSGESPLIAARGGLHSFQSGRNGAKLDDQSQIRGFTCVAVECDLDVVFRGVPPSREASSLSGAAVLDELHPQLWARSFTWRAVLLLRWVG
jgi:hypothetical protein